MHTILMLAFIVFWLVFSSIFVEAATELLVKSPIFRTLRNLLSRVPLLGRFFGPLFKCGYCTSVWVAVLPAVLIANSNNPVSEFIGFLPLSLLMWGLVIHRMSNYLHDFRDSYLDKYYSRNHYSSNPKDK